MSADRLREAAKVLRKRAEVASKPSPWWRSGISIETADYIFTMHPGVGLALADLLDSAAETADGAEAHAINWRPGDAFGIALAIADAILGGAR